MQEPVKFKSIATVALAVLTIAASVSLSLSVVAEGLPDAGHAAWQVRAPHNNFLFQGGASPDVLNESGRPNKTVFGKQ